MSVRLLWLLQIAVVLLVPPTLYAWRHRHDAGRALRGAALVLAATYAAFFGMFVVGEAFADPGGWTAVGGTAAWLVPTIALGLVAWYRPARASPLLGALLLGLVGVYVWSVATPDAWTAFEDSQGPIRALLAFALAGPLAVLGWKRPRTAGLLLVALPLLPALLALVNVARGPGPQGWPIAVVTFPAAVVGALYLAASFREGQRPPQDAPDGGSGRPSQASRAPEGVH